MPKLIEIECPDCHSRLWIDAESGQVVQKKKNHKKTVSSFDSLLQKEKQKKENADLRFDQARELEQEKKKKAAEIFEKSLKNQDT